MNTLGRLIAGAGAALTIAGCMHRGADTGVAAGDVAIDSLTATRTAILRVDNGSPATVRIYLVMPGMKPHYVARSEPGGARNWVLDPQMFPASEVSIEVRPEGGTPITLGPYKVNRNETIDVIVPTNVNQVTGNVRRSTK